MDVCTLFIIIIIIIVLVVIFVALAVWKMMAPGYAGVGAPHPYSGSGGPAMPPGTHRTYTAPQGADIAGGPNIAPPCPFCGRPGTFDTARHTFYCGSCRRWF